MLTTNESMTPTAENAPNSRTAGTSLTKSEMRPSAVVIAVNRQGRNSSCISLASRAFGSPGLPDS